MDLPDATVLDLVRQHAPDVKLPGHHDAVHKTECMFCFATTESPGGLFINLTTHQAFDEEHVQLDHERTGAVLYLHQQARRVPLSKEQIEAREATKPDKMAIGIAGGFQLDSKDYHMATDEALVLMPARLRIPLPCPALPELVVGCIAAVQQHVSATHQENIAAWEEERKASKYADGLEQLPATRKIPMKPEEWRCDETGTQDNLWLNLSTGFIGSGRQQYGMEGGGSALRHYEATGRKYPLVVKLGTITPHGADVYSYAADEDDMVLDPLLAQHLSHWGINMVQMEKTEKSMAELEIDQNLAVEFDKITEAGTQLVPLSGPGYVGLGNLGNTCYVNSVLQVLWALPEMRQRYGDAAARIFRTAPRDISSDFPTQFTKVGMALLTSKTGFPPAALTQHTDTGLVANGGGSTATQDTKAATDSVRPQAFKTLVGKGHAEFSSNRQQDAQEYFAHLLNVMSRAEHTAGSRLLDAAAEPTPSLFTFGIEDRIQCAETGRLAFVHSESTCLSLHIPLEAAENRCELEKFNERQLKRQKLKEEGEAGADAVAADADPKFDQDEHVVPRVPFTACLDAWAADQVVDDYASAAAGKQTQATKRTRFSSFPPYLLVQMQRYYTTETWEAKKRDVEVLVPVELNLELLRAQGLQAGELLQPDAAATGPGSGGSVPAGAANTGTSQPNDTIVAQLVSMGFSENGSKRAALAVGNSSAEAATNWVFQHLEDADFNDPLPALGPSTATAGHGFGEPSTESVAMLEAMGFSKRQAHGALAACQGSVVRAADWLFSHMDDLELAVQEALASCGTGAGGPAATVVARSSSSAPLLDGPGRYELMAIISHMGSNTACGHYVCHVKKDGRWVMFNDDKVAASQAPPFDRGYLYLYRRCHQ